MVEELTQISTREELFIRLYQNVFPAVASFVKKHGGQLEDAKDVFQDALVIYFEKHVQSDFSPQVTEQAYLTGIVRHLWYKKHRKNEREKDLVEESGALFSGEDPIVSKRLFAFVERSGKKCMELLSAFYYDKLSMQELAVRFGFSGERSATAQKFKCLEKVRESVRQHALTKDDFYE